MEELVRKQHDPSDRNAVLNRITGGHRVVVDFTGSYCAPCKLLEPILGDLANEYRDAIEVITIDIEEHPELAQRYGVRSVPTLIAFHSGQVRGQQVGFSHIRRVREMFEKLVVLK